MTDEWLTEWLTILLTTDYYWRLTDWLYYWRLTHWLWLTTDSLTDFITDDWLLNDWLYYRRLTDYYWRLNYWWMTDRMTDWLTLLLTTDWLTVLLTNDLLTDQLTDWLTDWPIDCVTDWQTMSGLMTIDRPPDHLGFSIPYWLTDWMTVLTAWLTEKGYWLDTNDWQRNYLPWIEISGAQFIWSRVVIYLPSLL